MHSATAEEINGRVPRAQCLHGNFPVFARELCLDFDAPFRKRGLIVYSLTAEKYCKNYEINF